MLGTGYRVLSTAWTTGCRILAVDWMIFGIMYVRLYLIMLTTLVSRMIAMSKTYFGYVKLLAVFAIFWVSCEKPSPAIDLPEHYWGEMHAMINDELWIAHPYASIRHTNQKSIIGFVGDVFEGYWHVQNFVIANVELKPGTVRVGQWYNDSIPYYLLILLDFDVALGYYLVEGDQAPKGSVTILEYDEATKEVKGTFEGVIYKKNLPDSLVIKDGYFHTRIYN